MKTRKRQTAMTFGLFVAAMVCAGGRLWGADGTPGDGNPHVWRPRTRCVAVFKNGLGFFLREGDVKLRDGWCVAEQVPPAAFGTLAIYARAGDATVDVVGSGPGEIVEFDGRDAPQDTAARRSRLETSRNLKVELRYEHQGEKRTAVGQLVSVGPDFAVLDGGSNSLAVPLAAITRMQVLELPLRVHVAGQQAAAPAQCALGMAYLRTGITWVPDYTLKVLDDETAELTLRGTIVNEAEDLIHAKTSRSAAAKRPSSPCLPGESTTGTSTAGHRRATWSTCWSCTIRPTWPGQPALAWP